jgi:carbon-monoxide dehydrogenase medium subunit
MIRAAIQFERPQSLDDALDILAVAGGEARIIGGGSILIPSLSASVDSARIVIDPARLQLDGISERNGTVVIGARVTYASLARSEIVRSRLPLLDAMVSQVTGGPGLWNLATLGGSACYGNPASDGPGCLVALNASFHLASRQGQRVVPASTFYTGAFATQRRPDEIMTAISVPTPPNSARAAYLKLKHSTSSWPIVTGACQRFRAGGVDRIRLSLGAVASTPVVMEWLLQSSVTEGLAEKFANEIVAAITEGWSDELADARYRMKVVNAVARRVLQCVLREV